MSARAGSLGVFKDNRRRMELRKEPLEVGHGGHVFVSLYSGEAVLYEVEWLFEDDVAEASRHGIKCKDAIGMV